MIELSEWQKLVAAQAIKDLFAEKHFNICKLEAIAKTIGVQCGGRLHEELRCLHCKDYADMHPSIREMLPQKVCEYLQSAIDTNYIEQMIADFEKPVQRLAGPGKLAKLLSFAKQ
jgi:hypothetical protein